MSNSDKQKHADFALAFQVEEQNGEKKAPFLRGGSASHKERQNGGRWLLIVSVLLILGSIVAVVAAGHLSPEKAAYRQGRLIGLTGIQAVGAYLIWRFLLNKRRGALLLLISLLLLDGSIRLLVSARLERSREYAAVDSLLKSLIRGEQIEIDDKQYGSLKPLAVFLNDHIVQGQEIVRTMENEMADQHLETMLTRETYEHPNEIVSAQKRLQEIPKIMDRCEAHFRTWSEHLLTDVMNLNLPEATKEEFFAGYNETKEQGLKNLSEYLAIKRSLASAYNDVLELVRSKRGKFRFQDEGIIFYSAEDLSKYNSGLQKVDRLIEEHDAWVTKQQGVREAVIQQLER